MKNLSLCLLSIFRALPLALVLPLMAAELNGSSRPDNSPVLPQGLSAADWGSIRAEYERHRHSAVATVDGYVMTNPGQQWQTQFDGTGFVVQPDNADWMWGLELKTYGFRDSESAPALPPRVTTNGSRVAYDWDDIVQEWFVNDQRGLEHGFTIRARPGNNTTNGSDQSDSPEAGASEVALQSFESLPSLLSFTMAVRGSLRPDISADGRSVQFSNDGGIAVLTYAGLKVWDAHGRILPARFEPVTSGESMLRLTVDERGARYPLTIDPIVQQAYLKASSTAEGGFFGNAVAASGETVVVSAYLDGSKAQASGVVYVFLRTGTLWAQQAVLRAPNAEFDDQFGTSVAISGDTIVVGAPYEDSSATGVGGSQNDNGAGDAGAAYVFFRIGNTWNLQGYLKASNTNAGDNFGASVAASGDMVAVGAPGEASGASGVNGNQGDNSAAGAGAAYVFSRTGATWNAPVYFKASNTDAQDSFGSAVALSGNTLVVGAFRESSDATTVNGNQANNSAEGAGAAYVFVRNAVPAWSQEAYLKASNAQTADNFGISVSVSGDTVVVGASREDSGATGAGGAQGDNSVSESGAAYVFFRIGMGWSQQGYLKASNTGLNDGFGESVAVSGDTVVVGARKEASNAVGVNGDGNNDNALGAGAAYIFSRSTGAWSYKHYLKASNTKNGARFGTAVAVAGNTIVAGAPGEFSSATGVNGQQTNDISTGSGAAYIFVPGTSTWSEQAWLKPYNPAVTNDQFGWSVAIAGDIAVVGAPQESSNATGINGNQADSSALNAGAAYVFHRDGGVWRQEAYLKASNTGEQDRFGASVGASGDFVVVGATEEDSGIGGVNHATGQSSNSQANSGAAYIFVRSIDGHWSQQAYVKASLPANLDRFGWSMSAFGETVVIGAPDQDTLGTAGAGAAYVFTRNGSVWTEQALLKASTPNGDDRFGTAVAMSGDLIVVGAEREDSDATGVNGNEINTNSLNSGAAYVFRANGPAWTREAYLKASNTGANDAFGWSVAAGGDTVVVGANLEDSNATGVNHPTGQSDDSAGGSGAAYVFTRSGGAWSQQAYLKASNTGIADAFGYSVAVSGDTVVVGAPVESSDATGVNGAQNNNNFGGSGAAYVFTRSGGIWSQQSFLKASNTGAGDSFGQALAMSGGTLVAGAFSEDSNARGVNGNQTDNSAGESGAAYVFNLQSQTALTSWRTMWFGSPDNSGPGADMADPDGDALENLLEFATGSEPLTRIPLPVTLTYNGSQMEFTYPRSKAAHAEMRFIVEWSDSLAANTWTINGTSETIQSDNGTIEQVKAIIAAGSSRRGFVRLRVVVN